MWCTACRDRSGGRARRRRRARVGQAPSAGRRGRGRCACGWRAASRRSSGCRRRARRRRRRALPSSAGRRGRRPRAGSGLDAEVALDEIGPAARLRIGLGRAPRLAAPLRADDPVRAHQPLHVAARHLLAGAPQRVPHPPVAVGVVVGRVQLAGSARAAARPRPLVPSGDRSPLVVGGHRHAQGPADRLDPEAAAVLVDVAAHFGRSGSSSLAKNTTPTSGSRSRGAARSSPCAAAGSPRAPRSSADPASPLSASAWRTRLRSASGVHPEISRDVRDRTADSRAPA